MNLTFHQWPWIKVMIKGMALRWVQCNNSVKYYSNSWTQWKVMAWTTSKTTIGIETLTFDQWPWVKVVTLPLVRCNNSVKFYSNPCFQWKLEAQTVFNPLWADLWTITLDQGHDTSLGPGQQFCAIFFKFIKRVRSYGQDKLFAYVLTILCIVTLTFDLGSRS